MTTVDFGIRGRIALVTGASKGIGFAIAEALAREGAAVFLCARGREALEEAARRIGADTVAFERADVSRPEDCERVIATCERTLGPIDILVNNAAGTEGPQSGFLALRDEDWLGTWQATLMSAVRMSRRVVPGMRERRWGRILMIASTSGRQPEVAVPHYNAAKAAMINLSKTLANAFAADGIRVNCICPGLVRTDAVERAAERRLRDAGADTGALSADERVERVFGTRGPIPVGRIGLPADVAGMATLLCSGQADWITGACIDVDGGWVRSIL